MWAQPGNLTILGRFAFCLGKIVRTEETQNWFSFRPKLVETLKGYGSADFLRDVIAGVTVGIVALPLAMAFAIASGVKPETDNSVGLQPKP